MEFESLLTHKVTQWVFIVVLSIATFFILSQKINLVTADLGRHLKNGAYFFQQGQVISTNFYSYTMPERPTLNHHWLSGVIFYIVHQLSGFYGLSLFYVGLYCVIVGIIFYLSAKKSGFYAAMFSFFVVLPLFAHRREIRPEIFSYLGITLFVYVFEWFKGKAIPKKWLMGILVYQLFWANSHIYAFFGPAITLLYIAARIICKQRKGLKNLLIFELLLVVTLFITPFGIPGFVQSLSIMNEYGYRLAENMNLLFMIKWSAGQDWIYGYGLLLIGITWGVLIYKFVTLRKTEPIDVLLVGMGIAALYMNRNLAIFGIILFLWESALLNTINISVKNTTLVSIGLGLLLMLFNTRLGLVQANTGMGLEADIEKSAEFYKTKEIQGPVFNNYDIGGYLIFELFPKEKVFVDNRPEAYGKDFFDTAYNPAIADEINWDKLDEQYNFNVIYFYRHDMTDYAQEYLYHRTQDPDWVTVYVDDWVIILVKNNDQNKKVIEKFEISREVFRQAGT